MFMEEKQMKNFMKKSVSALMIVVMLFTMVPLQGLVGVDISGWFTSIAEAAAPPGEDEKYIVYVGAKDEDSEKIVPVKDAKVIVALGDLNDKDSIIATKFTDADGKVTFSKMEFWEENVYWQYDWDNIWGHVLENARVYAEKNVSDILTISSSIGDNINDKFKDFISDNGDKVLVLDEAQCNIELTVAYVTDTFEDVKSYLDQATAVFYKLTGDRIKINYIYKAKSSDDDISTSNVHIRFYKSKWTAESNAMTNGYNLPIKLNSNCINTGLKANSKKISAGEIAHELCHYILGVYDEYLYGLGKECDMNGDGDTKDYFERYIVEDDAYVVPGSIFLNDRSLIDWILDGEKFYYGDVNKDGKNEGKMYAIAPELFELLGNNEIYKKCVASLYESEAGLWRNGYLVKPISGSFGIMESDYSTDGQFLSDSSTYSYLTPEDIANKHSHPERFTQQYYENNKSCQQVLDEYFKGKIVENCDYRICYSASVNAEGEEYTVTATDYEPEYTVVEDTTELKAIGNTDILDNSIPSEEDFADVDFTFGENKISAKIAETEEVIYAFVIDYDNLTKRQVEINNGVVTFDYTPGNTVSFYVLRNAEGEVYEYNCFDIGGFSNEVNEGLLAPNCGIVGDFEDSEYAKENFVVIADDKIYSNGDYKQLSKGIVLLNGGESEEVNCSITTSTSLTNNIDFSSVGVFKVTGDSYEMVSEGYYGGEDTAAYIDFSYSGDGTYVVMAKEASSDVYESAKNIKVKSGFEGSVDSAAYISFEDPNADKKAVAYNIYYKNEQFSSFDDEGVNVITIKDTGKTSTSLDFTDDIGDKYFSVEIVYENGAKSGFATPVKHQLKQFDSNNDGIPDIWLLTNGMEDHYGIAEEDPDKDGIINLDEYLNGTNPLINEDFEIIPDYTTDITDVIVAEELFDGFPKEIIELVADTMFNMEPVVDLTSYDISSEDAVALFSAIAKYYPTEYSLLVTSAFNYRVIVSPSLDRIMKIRFYYGDNANISDYQRRVRELQTEIDKLVAKMEGMTEFEKALYVHDYIVLNSEYDYDLRDYLKANGNLSAEIYNEKYSEYSILVNGTGICGSYALAYRAVLNAAGMECLYISSDQMNHAWNLVKVDGNWYHVDCCWDDGNEFYGYGYSSRYYFLRSDNEFMNLNHYLWSPGKYKANSERYSNMPRYLDAVQKYDDGNWYYLEDNTIYKTDVYGNGPIEITDIYTSTIDADEGKIYYSKGRYVYAYNIETSENKIVYAISSSDLGRNPSYSPFVNIYVDGNEIEFYKKIYRDGKYTVAFDSDTLDYQNFDSITGVLIDKTEETVDVFGEIQLSAEILSTSEVAGIDIMWKSSDNNIASVNEYGRVKGMNAGEAIITAECMDYTATCKVTVSGDGVSGVCGDNATWYFDSAINKLSINGTGTIINYSEDSESPWSAFNSNIKTAEISDGITGIGEYAFYGCESLENVMIPDSVKDIGIYAFAFCTSLTKVDIPNGITCIEENLFQGCTNLKNVTIPDSVLYINYWAFDDCKSLERIVLPNGLKEILNGAFSGCESVYSINIPDDLTYLNSGEFSDCLKLKEFTVNQQCKNYSSVNGVLFNKDKTDLISCPPGKIEEFYKIPDSVTKVWGHAFENCSRIKSIEIPDTVTYIGAYAFEYANLSNDTLPNGVTSIGSRAFYGSVGLETIFITDKITEIGSEAFAACSTIKSIMVDENNKNWSSDEYGVLFNKDKTKLICYPAGNISEQYNIPFGVVEIDYYAFSRCVNLKNIDFPDTVETINNSAFTGCKNLISIILPDSVTKLGSSLLTSAYVFQNCINLKNVAISNGVQKIEKGLFYGCYQLKKIKIPSAVTSINADAFINSGIEFIEVDENNQKFSNDSYGVLYNKDKTKLLEYPGCNNSTVFITPNSVTNIAKGAFDDACYLKTVILSGSVNRIESFAFEKNSSISKMFIYNSSCKSIMTGLPFTISLSLGISNNVVLYGYSGSTTETYANEKGISFVAIESELHTHDYFLMDYAEATEGVDGYEYYECYCGEASYTTTLHYYGEETTIEPTCTLNGTKTQTCLNCGEVNVLETTPATGKHDYKLVSTVPGDCTVAPMHTYECSVCHDSYTKEGRIDDGHNYVETIVEPTCDEKGCTFATCSKCGETVIYDFTSPTGHEFTITRSEDYCEAHGTLEYSCKKCDYYEKIASDGSNLVTETVTVEPTCTKSGSKTEICTLCKATISTEILNPLSHDYEEEFTVDKAATCTAEGSKSQHCTRCDANRAVTVIEATGHQNTSIINVVESTCAKNGYSGDTFCSDCNSVIANGTATEKLSHTESDWITDKASTCIAEGSKHTECTECSEVIKTEAIAKLSHEYISVVTKANCENSGYTTYTCSNCSDSYVSDKTPAIGHNYVDGVCTACGESKIDNCSHMCHKTGFMGFIWKIVRFFWKLFGMNPVCECGVAHY